MLKKIINDNSNKHIENMPQIDGGIYRTLTFDEIYHIMNNKELEYPEEQCNIDEERVDEMYKCYKKNKKYFMSKCLVTIGVLDEYYFIIDGQHRLEMIHNNYKELSKSINPKVLFAIYELKDEEELCELFLELNKDSEKNKLKLDIDIFGNIRRNKFKKMLAEKYSDLYSKKRNSKTHLFTIDEFVNKLSDKELICFSETDYDYQYVIDLIDKSHAEFYNKIKYSNLLLDKNLFFNIIYQKN